MGGDVRTSEGVPKLSAFANGSGTPLVIDVNTALAYFTTKGTVVPLGGGGSGGDYLPITGGTLTGGLIINPPDDAGFTFYYHKGVPIGYVYAAADALHLLNEGGSIALTVPTGTVDVNVAGNTNVAGSLSAERARITNTSEGVLSWAANAGYDFCNSGARGFYTAGGGAYAFLTSSNGDFTTNGNVIAYSDARLKKDLEVIPNALDKVMSLTGYTYTRIDTGARQSGLLAQDVEKVLPEVVTHSASVPDGELDTLGLAYGNMVGLLVEAIKELRAEVDALRRGCAV